jgi:flavorubredoxin
LVLEWVRSPAVSLMTRGRVSALTSPTVMFLLTDEVPKEYGVTKYRYTVVNDRTVLVDPGTHRIVQVIE